MNSKTERHFCGFARHVPAYEKMGRDRDMDSLKKHFDQMKELQQREERAHPGCAVSLEVCNGKIYSKVTRKFDEEEIRSAVEWWRQQQEEDDRSLRFGLSKEL